MSQIKQCHILAASFFLAIGLVSDANAQLTGSTVNLSAYFPDSSTVYDNPGNKVVSAAVEYPAGSFQSYNMYWEANITNSQLIVNWTNPSQGNFSGATFNGFILSVISGPVISSASINPSSAFTPLSLTIDGSNRVLMNYQGVIVPGSSSSIIDFSFVPEPTAVTLAGVALGFVVGGLPRNRKYLHR